jgi:membrane protein DedA with SNARE-associated domain
MEKTIDIIINWRFYKMNLVDVILHVDKYLDIIIKDYGFWSYLFLFIIIFCETGLVITPFLPGDSLLFAAGTFAALGSFNIGLLVLVLTLAAILGDTTNYFIGYHLRPQILTKNKIRFIKEDHLNKGQEFYDRHGGKAIIFARFMPIIRTLVPFVAGLSDMTYKKFMFYNLIGGITWISSMTLGGYLFGNIPLVKNNFSAVVLLIIFVSLLPGFISYFRHIFKNQRSLFTIPIFIKDKIYPLNKYGYTLLIGILLALGSLLIFSKLAEDLIYNELNQFDLIITNYITGYHKPAITLVMKFITNIGSVSILIPFTLLTLWYLYKQKKHYWDSVMVLVALSGGWFLDLMLKLAFHRPRPDIMRIVDASGYSFPSGHSMVATTFYGFVAYLAWLNLANSKIRYLTTIGFIALIMLIGISRIYLGVHYPSDVLAGFAAGGFWLFSCIVTLEGIRYYKRKATR